MERKKLTRSRRSYYDDYKKTASGEYIYAGPEYEYISKNGTSRKKWMLMLILLDIIAFAVVLIPGFLHVPGLNYCAYVILPYAAGILLTGYLLVVLIRLAAARDSVKAWEYDRSVKVLPTATVGAVIVGALNVVCEIVYIAKNGAGDKLNCAIIYIVCFAVLAVLAVFMAKTVLSAEWKRKSSDSPEF